MQDSFRVFDHFVNIRRYKVKVWNKVLKSIISI